jgi:hypothetical protein
MTAGLCKNAIPDTGVFKIKGSFVQFAAKCFFVTLLRFFYLLSLFLLRGVTEQ